MLAKPDIPMLPQLVEVLLRHGAKEVYLLGSRRRGDARPDSDLDFAVRGLPRAVFFDAMGDMMMSSSIAVDLIDLDVPGPKVSAILKSGELLRVG